MTWRSDLIASMTRDEATTMLALIAGGCPEAFDRAFGGVGGSLAERFRRAEVRECRHCGEEIARCPGAHATVPEFPPCKGWRHTGLGPQPVISHCCGGCGTNPAAEPAESGKPGCGGTGG